MTALDPLTVVFNLVARQVLFKMLRIEFDREPKDEAGIKLCDEQIETLEKRMDDIIINGTGDLSKDLVGDFMKREVKYKIGNDHA